MSEDRSTKPSSSPERHTFQKENLKETFYLMIGIGYRF